MLFKKKPVVVAPAAPVKKSPPYLFLFIILCIVGYLLTVNGACNFMMTKTDSYEFID